VLHPLSQVVYAAGRQHVRDVWIDGRPRVVDGELVDTDVAALRAMARRWGERITALPNRKTD
jgi:5-methylthioadenosine/S-adenosylhomocysteine deaminase